MLTGVLALLVAAGGGAPAGRAATGPNGLIAYQCITGGGLSTDICTVDPATGVVVNLTNDAVDDAFPDWSPDGTQIVFDSFRSTNQPNIHVMNADGTDIRRISATDCCEADFQPVWSPDGGRIAFVSTRDGDGEYELYVMEAAGELGGTPAIRLTNDPPADFGQGINDWQATWSADSGRLAFMTNRDEAEHDACDLWVMEAADADGDGFGDNLTRITFDNDFECTIMSPAWSPTGERIAFTSTRSGDYEVWVINSDGSNPVNVTNFPGQDFDAGWSPDGTMITFVSGRDGDYELFAVPAPPPGPFAAGVAATAEATQITHNDTNDVAPDWGVAAAGDTARPLSLIKKPVDGGAYAPRRIRGLNGTADGTGSAVARVQVALRQELTGGTCRWWNGSAFVARKCAQKLWVAAAGTEVWTYRLTSPLTRSVGTEIERYVLFSRAVDAAGNRERSFVAGRNANRFEVT